MSNGLKVTGFCWNCGQVSVGLFCRDVCKRKYERRFKKAQEDAVRDGHRRGYGLKGSTH